MGLSATANEIEPSLYFKNIIIVATKSALKSCLNDCLGPWGLQAHIRDQFSFFAGCDSLQIALYLVPLKHAAKIWFIFKQGKKPELHLK